MAKRILLIIPSAIVARGLEQVFARLGEFEVSCILSDLPANPQAQLSRMEADAIILDPSLFGYAARGNGKALLSAACDAAILAVETSLLDDNTRKQYDGVISLSDAPADIIRTVRQAVSERTEQNRSEGEGLSVREREILVCVAKGMLNKEIADHFNISIHTVITHRKNITRKTGIKTVAGLTVYALMNGLIEMSSIE